MPNMRWRVAKCPVCGESVTPEKAREVEMLVKFLLDEDAFCFKLIERIAQYAKEHEEP